MSSGEKNFRDVNGAPVSHANQKTPPPYQPIHRESPLNKIIPTKRKSLAISIKGQTGISSECVLFFRTIEASRLGHSEA